MSEAMLGLVTGAKVAIFVLAIVYSYLAHLRMNKFNFGWIGASAASLLLISVAEFLIILEESAGTVIFRWIVLFKNQIIFTDAMFLVAGLTMYMFLYSVKEDS